MIKVRYSLIPVFVFTFLNLKTLQVRDRAWFVRMYGELIPELIARGLSTVQAHIPCFILFAPRYIQCRPCTLLSISS